MPRLLYLCEYGTLCGGEHSLLSVLPGVQAAGFQVAVAAPAGGLLRPALQAAGVETIPLDVAACGGSRGLAERRESIVTAARPFRPDLIHANSLSMSRLSGPVARELGVVGVGHIRDIVGLSQAAVADLNQHTRLLAVSHAARDYHVARGLDAARTFTLYNGVDLERFTPGRGSGGLHRELGLPPETRLIGFIGQTRGSQGRGCPAGGRRDG